jgi:hypothetical protein
MQSYVVVYIQLYPFSNCVLGGGVWSASRFDPFTPGNEPWYPFNMHLVCPRSQSGSFGEELNFLLSLSIVEPLFLRHLVLF